MKYLKKCLVMIILMILFIAYPKVEAINNRIVKQDSNKITSVKTVDVTSTIINEKEKEAEDKPKCQYKEGEVIITYEQSFWNSKTKLSLDSVINKYIVDETLEFDEIKIDSDNTVSISDDDSNESTLAISKVKSDKHTTQELIDLFKDKDWIISVEPNYIIKPTSLTNDTYEKYQWAIENNGQNSGTKNLDVNPIYTSSDKEKVIAIIDTGIDYTHEDLKNIMWVNPYSKDELPGTYGYNFVYDDDDPMDDNGHGSCVAGIIAGESNNNKGISGTILGASNIKLMALKALDYGGGSSDIYDIIQAYNYIYKAQKLGTNIVAINNSWGTFVNVKNKYEMDFANSLSSVINIVGEKGALSICAAGNEKVKLNEHGEISISINDFYGKEREEYLQYADEEGNVIYKQIPSGLDSQYIISVAASTENDDLARFSNYGESIDIAAPGTSIITSTIENQYIGYDPLVLSKEEQNKLLRDYYTFDNGLEGLNYTLTYGNEQSEHQPDKGKVTISSDKYYGTSGKSLKWTFYWTEEDEQRAREYRANWPCLQLNLNQFGDCCTSIAVYVDGPEETSGAVNLWAPWAVQPEDKLPEEEYCTYLAGANFDENYWDVTNYNWPAFAQEPFLGRIDVMAYPDATGEYTVYIDNLMISKPFNGVEETHTVKYTLENGTSMATPFVTGAVGTMSNLYEDDTALQLKDKILSCTRKNPSLEGKVATGGVLDLYQLNNPIPDEPEPSEPTPEEPSKDIPVQGISLNKSKQNMTVGDELQLIATVTPENATNKNVKWKSSNSKIATVENGKIKAIAEGTATITATTEEGNLEAKCVITVNKKQLKNISDCQIEGIVPAYRTGEKVKLNLSIYNGNKKLVENTDYKVSYKNNTNVGDATVTISGVGNYTGKITKNFKIINRPNISAKIDHYITSAFSRGRALDLKNGATNAGNNIQLKTLSCGKTQKYKIIKNKKDESFYIQNVESKKYLGVNDKNTGKAKTKVVLADNNTTPGTKWYIGQNSDASISFYTKDGLVIEALENNNTNLQINVSNNSSLQKFITTRTDYISAASISTTKVYYIVSSINNKKAIDVYAAGTADYTNVDIYDLNKTNAQKFKFQKNSDGSYTIINKGSNKAIDVFENKTANMTNIDIYTKNNTTAQKWYVIKNLDGTITFLGSESGKALDLYAADTTNFNNINIWDWNQTDAQKWKLIN